MKFELEFSAQVHASGFGLGQGQGQVPRSHLSAGPKFQLEQTTNTIVLGQMGPGSITFVTHAQGRRNVTRTRVRTEPRVAASCTTPSGAHARRDTGESRARNVSSVCVCAWVVCACVCAWV